MKKIIVFIIIIGLTFSMLTHRAGAVTLTRDQLKIDNSLVDDTKNSGYITPTSINILVVYPPIRSFNIGTADWYKGIYYYFAGRLKFGDIPFHYVFGQDGTAIRGAKNGVEQKINVVDGTQNAITIAYLADSETQDFTKTSQPDLENFLLEVANANAIPIKNITIQEVDFIKNDKGINLQAGTPSPRFLSSLELIKNNLTPKYAPIKKDFKVTLTEVKIPTTQVNPLAEVVVSLKLKNTGEFGIFKGADNEIIASKTDGKASIFYKGDQWLSQSKLGIMVENSFLRPGEEKVFEVKISVPLYVGEVSEEFQLSNLGGQDIPNAKFKITLNIAKGNFNIVEIMETETGSLNVRTSPGGNAPLLTTVLPGQRFIELERTNNGWVKIKISETQQGWVSNRYVKKI